MKINDVEYNLAGKKNDLDKLLDLQSGIDKITGNQ